MAVEEQNGTGTRKTVPNYVFETAMLWPWSLVYQIGVGLQCSMRVLPTRNILWFCGCCSNVCRNVGSPGPESVPLASEWQQCFYFGRPASFQPAAQACTHRAPSCPWHQSTSRHPPSPADTTLQHPPKSNAANGKVMTARTLLDLHANSSLLASHSPSTGKMRRCTSFQTISWFSTVHTHTRTNISCRLHYTCFPKSWPTTSRDNMGLFFFSLVRTELQM